MLSVVRSSQGTRKSIAVRRARIRPFTLRVSTAEYLESVSIACILRPARAKRKSVSGAMARCIVCGKKLTGRQRKYCGNNCSSKAYYRRNLKARREYNHAYYKSHKKEKHEYNQAYYKRMRGIKRVYDSCSDCLYAKGCDRKSECEWRLDEY